MVHEWSDNELEELENAKRGKLRRKPMPWTAEQHQLFLMGLNKYGQGQWRNISRYYVVDKTPSQVASHAYKFFRRCSNNTSTPPAN